jgi:hypothetical protein
MEDEIENMRRCKGENVEKSNKVRKEKRIKKVKNEDEKGIK